ncbi:hypothetical protein PS880_05863 [Pseudomonas fluorescens]|uniref:Uncharacterized protein n=1 Tax=Pseudomonas fluorescens TaxID=294 RepID=A0A5E7Q6Z8_PSEFL|nr:hypothetical protein PS880_05863 [Pseudomonas fluorescens]
MMNECRYGRLTVCAIKAPRADSRDTIAENEQDISEKRFPVNGGPRIVERRCPSNFGFLDAQNSRS